MIAGFEFVMLEPISLILPPVQAPPKTVRDPLEAIVRVERLRDSGLLVAAREVLDEALRMHPEDDELRALAAEGWYASPDVPPGPASPALTPRSP